MTLRASFLLLVLFGVSCGLAVSGSMTETDAGTADGAAPVEDGAGDDASPADGSPADASPDGASPADAAGGPITLIRNSTGKSSGMASAAVSLAPSPATLFLAAVATKPRVGVSVSGGGLTWSPLKVQCGEDDQTGIAVWIAKRTADGEASGVVTATFDRAPNNAVMAVSAYTGAHATGSVVSANTHGVDGGCEDNGNGTATFSLPVAQPPGSVLYGAIALRLRTVTGTDGGSEVFFHLHQPAPDGGDGDTAGLAIMGTRAPATALSGTLSGDTGWAIVGVELLP